MLPCEICGPENECTCPPCDCVWCRHSRGEDTPNERRMIDARDRAFRKAELRAWIRENPIRLRRPGKATTPI